MKIYKISTNITNEEKETILRYDYIDKCWYVDTSVPAHITKFTKQGWEIVSQTVNEDNVVQAVEFKCNNLSSITIGKADKKKRELTEEQRQKLAERMKKIRNQKSKR